MGYPSVLAHVANFARRHDYQVASGSVQTTGELLTPNARKAILTAFAAPLFDRYGSAEVGIVAHECDAHDGLHILAENNWVELVDRHGHPVSKGQVGRIVVTNLNNFAQPFIRYDYGRYGCLAE